MGNKKEELKGGEQDMNQIMIPKQHYVCNKCKHIWMPRPGATNYPRACPGCKSVRWDKEEAQTENVKSE